MAHYIDEDEAWNAIQQANTTLQIMEFIGPVFDKLRDRAMKAALSDDEYAKTPHMRDRHIARVNALDDIKFELERIVTRGQSARILIDNQKD